MTTPQLDSQPVWQSFIDLNNDAKPFMQWPAGTTAQDSLLQDTIDAACWWAQDFLGRPIAPTTFFRRFNGYTGWGGSTIDLPYYPVLGIPSITEYWGVSGPHTLTFQTPQAQGGSDMFTFEPLTGIVTRSYLGLLARPTFPGLKNIEVTWTAGYEPIPPHWRRGVLLLTKHWYDCTQQASRGLRVRDQYGDVPEGGHDMGAWPGVPSHIESLFATAQQVGIA